MIEDYDFNNINTFVNALGRIIQLKDIKIGNIIIKEFEGKIKK